MDQQKDNNSLTHWKYTRRIRKGNRYVYFYDTNAKQQSNTTAVKDTLKDLEASRLAKVNKTNDIHDKNIATEEELFIKETSKPTDYDGVQSKVDACNRYIEKFETYQKTTAYTAAVKKKGKAAVESTYKLAISVLNTLRNFMRDKNIGNG